MQHAGGLQDDATADRHGLTGRSKDGCRHHTVKSRPQSSDPSTFPTLLPARDAVLLGRGRPAGLPAAGRPPLRLPEDRRPLHRQGRGLGRRQLHLQCEEPDDQRLGLQLAHAGGAAP